MADQSNLVHEKMQQAVGKVDEVIILLSEIADELHNMQNETGSAGAAGYVMQIRDALQEQITPMAESYQVYRDERAKNMKTMGFFQAAMADFRAIFRK